LKDVNRLIVVERGR